MPLITLNRPRIALFLIFFFCFTALFLIPYESVEEHLSLKDRPLTQWDPLAKDSDLPPQPHSPERLGEDGPPLGMGEWHNKFEQMEGPPAKPSSPSTNWPPPSSSPPSSASESKSPTILTNNNVTYPRLDPGISISRQKAREFIDRIERIKENIFQPMNDDVNKYNHWHLDRLQEYLKRAELEGGYKPPRVVLTSWHWVPCAYGPCTTGEVQWIRPLVDIMKEEKIFYLFSFYDHFRTEFKMLGSDLISHVWMDEEHLLWCYNDDVNCVESERNPEGIPLWKMFAFTFWGSRPGDQRWDRPKESFSFNPLGSEWNLVPYQMPDKQFYLGYHYQGCHSLPHIPHDKRKNQIVVLAKLSEYFHKWPAYDPKTFYTSLAQYTGYEILSNADVQDGYPVPEGVKSLGLLPPDEYDLELANTKALLGIGKPPISPTPFASLCRGVPVIIPYRSKNDEKTCSARPGPNEWCGFDEDVHQHGPASFIGEPYVYSVDVAGPMEDVLKTVKKAVETPIEPYEPPEMSKEAVKKRLLDYFEVDWEEYAQGKPMRLADFLVTWLEKNPDPVRH